MRIWPLLVLGATGCDVAEAPYLNATAPPEHADVAIAASRDAIAAHAPEPIDIEGLAVEWTFVAQGCIDVDGTCVPAFTNLSSAHGLRSFVVIRDRYWDSVAHELVHCALFYSTGDLDVDHALVAWWGDADHAGAIAAIQADVADAMAGLD